MKVPLKHLANELLKEHVAINLPLSGYDPPCQLITVLCCRIWSDVKCAFLSHTPMLTSQFKSFFLEKKQLTMVDPDVNFFSRQWVQLPVIHPYFPGLHPANLLCTIHELL